jgi:hypothetical protein
VPAPVALPVETDSSGCLLVSYAAQGSVPIKNGTRICARETGDHVAIVRVTEKEIAFKVNGGWEKYCGPNDQCELNWSAGQVLFRVRLNNPSQAELVLARW